MFNSDYVRENLSWEQPTQGIPPILVLGESNIRLQKQINRLAEDRSKLMIEREQLQNNNRTTEQELSNSLTDEARRMTNELSLGRSFNRNHLRSLLDDPDVGIWNLSPTEFKHVMGTAQSSNKLGHIPERRLKTNRAIITDTRALLKKTVSPSKTIERLRQDVSIET